jgi:phosphatidylserine/phosphatidylglycerophosphate/cardiolipin synthase-like enzyme
MLERGELTAPLVSAALSARGLGSLSSTLQPYAGLDANSLRTVIEAVLCERQHRQSPKLTLVWTGDDPRLSQSRHTKIYLPELFARARKQILIAGYSFDQSAQLFEALHDVMVEHGVLVQLFVDIGQLLERLKQVARQQGRDFAMLSKPLQLCRDPLSKGNATVTLFFQLLWPFDGARPRVYFDQRTASQCSLVSLHAKCVVVDHLLSLITSANFTERGQSRNFEAGVEIEDEAFALSLARQWQNLIDEGVVVEATG